MVKSEILLSKSRKEKQTSFNYIDAKKSIRREDLTLYMIDANADKINTNTIYVAIQTLLSIYWQNRITVKFIWRDRFDRERSLNTNKIAKYDYKEMWISTMDYILEFYRLMYGVWVQISDWFDFNAICPKIKNINPLSCFPDPYGWPTIHSHRFFGFETNLSEWEMEDLGYKNIDKLHWLSTNEDINKQKVDAIRWYTSSRDDIENKIHTVYIHFTRCEKKLYLIASNPSCTVELKIMELPAVTKEEKKDYTKIQIPVALKYYSYLPWDFFGVSPVDLLKDKQSMYWKLFNAMIAMAIRNAYGDDRLVDVNKIIDINWLQQPTLEWKIIPVKIAPNEALSSALYQVPKDDPGTVPFNVKSYIEDQSQLEIGIDRNTSGVLSNSNSTLWEREMAQRNANIRFLLATKQWTWFEEFRWSYLWYRSYVANLKSADKKIAIFNSSYWKSSHIFNKDDFIGTQDMKIEIVNEAEREQDLQAKKADRMSLLPQLIAWARTYDDKVILYRELLEAQWEDEDYILWLFPITPTEIKARDKVELINWWDKRWAIIDDINEDHNVFIRLMNRDAEDGELKIKALQSRYEALAYKQQQAQQTDPSQWQWQPNQAEQNVQSATSAQLVNNSIQKWRSSVPSLQDITK